MKPPRMLYGTAWKEDETERLTLTALEQGFRGIDTANQRKHYHEAGVGAAIARAMERGLITRDQLFLQTKFTSPGGQDQRIPYDPNSPPEQQVRDSFQRSLVHLGVRYVDSYVLHGPSTRSGLAPYDRAVWRAMADVHVSGGARLLGVSNVALDQLELLVGTAKVRPSFVQNRCYARTGWDREVRAFCARHGIVYQGFSLLTANRHELERPEVRAMAEALRCTVAQLVFAFSLSVGMQVLTGTTQVAHMAEDLRAGEIVLSEQQRAVLESIGG